MKKILGISLFAMMAVTTANAEIASKAYVQAQDTLIKNTIGTMTDLATEEQGTVVGAINELASATSGENGLDSRLTTLEETVADADTGLAKTKQIADAAVVANSAIEAGTATKITYDAKGLVTGGADLAIADLPENIVVAGINTTVTHTADGDYAVNVPISGAVEANNTGLVTGGQVQAAIADATTTAGMLTTTNYATTLDPVYVNTTELATTTTKGIMQVGSDLAVADGVVSVTKSNAAVPAAGATTGAIVTDTAVRATVDALNLGSMAQETASNYKKTTELDSATTATTGQVVTAISMQDGQLSQTTADPLDVTSYTQQPAGTDLGAGSYSLTMKVGANGVRTYAWELIERAE